jgi:hypothetical protein
MSEHLFLKGVAPRGTSAKGLAPVFVIQDNNLALVPHRWCHTLYPKGSVTLQTLAP